MASLRDLMWWLLTVTASVAAVWGSADLTMRLLLMICRGKPFIGSIFPATISNELDLPFILLWTAAFSLLSCTLVFTIKWALSRDSSVPYVAGASAGFFCFFVYHLSLMAH